MSVQLTVLKKSPVALADMSVPQLAEACHMLDTYQEKIESMSGICATMRGLVFQAVKERLGHGKFLPWLAKNFSKTRKTSAQDMRIAREFRKSNPELHFESLARALAEKSREPEIDRNHPFVREIADWAEGRTRYQLLLDFPPQSGGYPRKNGTVPKDYDPNAPAEIAREIWEPMIKRLEREGLERCSWKDLRRADLEWLRGVLIDLNRAIKGGK